MNSTTSTVDPRSLQSFAQFYPFYLSEHSDRTCRRLHFVGSSLSLLFLATAVATASWWWLLAAIVVGYAFAWIGHFGFEKNKPASFKRPLYSFMGDWVMYKDIWTGRIPF
ncbi:MAG: Mpo1-like protein [Ramlibacter sp.]